MPPNTILLSQMMRELSAQPGFTEALIDRSTGRQERSRAAHARARRRAAHAFGQDWHGLDRFPGWTMHEINPTVRVVGHVAGKDEKLEDASAVHPGAPTHAGRGRNYLDLGPYALDKAETISLEKPSDLPPFTTEGIVTDLGAG